jgi:hypothetical protein
MATLRFGFLLPGEPREPDFSTPGRHSNGISLTAGAYLPKDI